MIKAYPEVKIRRFDTVTVMQCYTKAPGAAVSRVLDEALAGWRSRVVHWAMANIRMTIAKKQKEVDGYLDEKPEITTFGLSLINAGQEVLHEKSADTHNRCSPDCKSCKLREITEEVRAMVATYLDVEDSAPVGDGNGLSTELRPGIFEAWKRASGDPETEV